MTLRSATLIFSTSALVGGMLALGRVPNRLVCPATTVAPDSAGRYWADPSPPPPPYSDHGVYYLTDPPIPVPPVPPAPVMAPPAVPPPPPAVLPPFRRHYYRFRRWP